MATLGELERRVMQVLWNTTDAVSVRAVHEQVATDRDLAYTTVMTVLDRLSKKGVVSREQIGRAWHYRAAHTQAALVADEMASLLAAAGDEGLRVVGEFLARLNPEQTEHARLCLGAR